MAGLPLVSLEANRVPLRQTGSLQPDLPRRPARWASLTQWWPQDSACVNTSWPTQTNGKTMTKDPLPVATPSKTSPKTCNQRRFSTGGLLPPRPLARGSSSSQTWTWMGTGARRPKQRWRWRTGTPVGGFEMFFFGGGFLGLGLLIGFGLP